MRRLIGTSFKMNLTSTEVRRYFEVLRPLIAHKKSCDLFVLPPFTSLWVARELLAETNLAWGAQNVSAEEPGAHTGEVSAGMLADLGCAIVEVGHSERRRDNGETDALVAAKVRQILNHGMSPLVCVGEPVKGTVAAGLEHVVQQVRNGLGGLERADRDRIVIAYEPVWAIGEGSQAADPRHVSGVHRGLHDFLASPAGGGVDVRVIYGGSVDERTAGALLAEPGVDGLFVGRAALDPLRFAAIVAEAEQPPS